MSKFCIFIRMFVGYRISPSNSTQLTKGTFRAAYESRKPILSYVFTEYTNYFPIKMYVIKRTSHKKTCSLFLCLHSPLFVLDTPRLTGSYHTVDSLSTPQESHLRSLRAGHDRCIIIPFARHRPYQEPPDTCSTAISLS